MAKLEDVKAILEIVYREKQTFGEIDVRIQDAFERLEMRSTMKEILSDSYGILKRDSSYMVDEE